MNKDKKIFIGSIIFLFIFMVVVGITAYKKENNKNNNKTTDSIIFKNEYESLNNVLNEKNGKTIKALTINETNPVDILSEEEVLNVLENGTGLLYLGFPDCPWCRSMLPVLLQTLDNANVNRLYYLNIKDIRDELSLGEKNKIEVKTEGTKSYYKMLELMDEFLDKYYLTNDDGKKIDTKEKRIYAPTVVGVKKGKIVGIHVGTVSAQTDPYEALTKEQEEELSNQFIELINKVYEISCDEHC